MVETEGITLFTNAPRNFVLDPFRKLCDSAAELQLAAPFFTRADEILAQVDKGKSIKLIVGLNPATDPLALKQIHGKPGVSIRFFTKRYHAKIFLFGDSALVGSSNITKGGLMTNREATILFDQVDHAQIIDEIKAFFAELWLAAAVLTDEKLAAFEKARTAANFKVTEAEKQIEKAVGTSEPINARVDSWKKSSEYVFLEDLRRMVYEQYRPSFQEIGRILDEFGLHRRDLSELSPSAAVNRFLNWVRLEHAPLDTWKDISPLESVARADRVRHFGSLWKAAANNRVDPEFIDWFNMANEIFGPREALANADRDRLTNGLLSLHAFSEQLRFTKGGRSQLGPVFWDANNNDVARVRSTIDHLLYGEGDFIERLHDTLYDPSRKLKLFARFTALELYGTIMPDKCPPMNGRMAKAMRFLGYNVRD